MLAVVIGGVAALPVALAAEPALTHLPPAKFGVLPELQEPIGLESINRPLLVAAIFHETNRRRTAEGLPAFLPLDRLNEAADAQAAMMALRQKMEHDNPIPGQRTPLLRVRQTGIEPERVAENVATTPLLNPPAQSLFVRIENGRKIFSAEAGGPEMPLHTYASFARAVLDQWMNSPVHRANIMNRHLHRLGCATRGSKTPTSVDAIYSVQVFCALPERGERRYQDPGTDG